uniref:Uncharacterized protein n=1 Tax=Megaselia scalaris TaxID=36166 RepID=T1GKM1_MEGSC
MKPNHVPYRTVNDMMLVLEDFSAQMGNESIYIGKIGRNTTTNRNDSDGIPAELLKTAGSSFNRASHLLLNRIWMEKV